MTAYVIEFFADAVLFGSPPEVINLIPPRIKKMTVKIAPSPKIIDKKIVPMSPTD